MKFDKQRPGHWFLLLQQAALTLLVIIARPFSKKPPIPAVVLYGHQFSGNLKALYHQWQDTHVSQLTLYVLSLDPQQYDRLKSEGINVLKCSSPRDMLMLSRASAMITDHGLHAMAPLVTLTDIVFIDVWHGIPFKGFQERDFKLQQRYREVWVSSPLLKAIYQSRFGFASNNVRSLGYARTDQLFQTLRASRSADTKKTPEKPGKKSVLFAPTWQQDHQARGMFPFGESAESFLQRMGKVCEENNAILLVRSHLNASIGLTPSQHVQFCSQTEFPDTEQLLLQADTLICDWSSIAFDYLALNRPTIFLSVPAPFKNGFTLDESYRFGDIAIDMPTLEAMLARNLSQPDAYASKHEQAHARVTRDVYGDNTDACSASRQLNRLLELIQ